VPLTVGFVPPSHPPTVTNHATLAAAVVYPDPAGLRVAVIAVAVILAVALVLAGSLPVGGSMTTVGISGQLGAPVKVMPVTTPVAETTAVALVGFVPFVQSPMVTGGSDAVAEEYHVAHRVIVAVAVTGLTE